MDKFYVASLLLIAFLMWTGILPFFMDTFFTFLNESVTLKNFHVHKWRYYVEDVPLPKELKYRDTIKMQFRECTKCGQKQYRTMRPRMNGLDNNEWVNFKGKMKLKVYGE